MDGNVSKKGKVDILPSVGPMNIKIKKVQERGDQMSPQNCLFAELDGLGFVVHLFDDGEGF